MNNDINIAYRAKLNKVFVEAYNNFKIELQKLSEFNKHLPRNLKEQYQSLVDKQYIYGMYSALEILFGDTAVHLLVGYPAKIGKQQNEIELLTDVNSLTEAIRFHASKKIDALSYQTPESFFSEIYQLFGENLSLDDKTLSIIIEGKATRDIYMHNNGKSNHIYFKKAGKYARVADIDKELSIDDQYLEKIQISLLKLAEDYHKKCLQKHSKDTPSQIFKRMWEMSALNYIVEFDRQWEIIHLGSKREEVVVKEFSWGWSGSESALFNFFRLIHQRPTHHDENTGIIDIPYAMYRWKGTINERIIQSWLESQFYL